MPETLSEVLKKMLNDTLIDHAQIPDGAEGSEYFRGYITALAEIGRKFEVNLPYSRIDPIVQNRKNEY